VSDPRSAFTSAGGGVRGHSALAAEEIAEEMAEWLLKALRSSLASVSFKTSQERLCHGNDWSSSRVGIGEGLKMVLTFDGAALR